ncbi:MAG TPA: alpha/beta hydrolase [Roseiflexaceae bacterium]|nr:alpha/beta hydrolase [Roseiflexaceae bacterium]
MSALHLDNRLVHYENIGRRGQPIIFLHSWLGSWRYWLPTMEHISERYRAFALDFWGFGESDQREGTFSLTDYVTMVTRFMDHLGMEKVNLVGHGLGGMVAIRAASERPDRFWKIMAVNTPLRGDQVHDMQRGGGSGTFARLFGRSNPTNIWAKKVRDMAFDDQNIQREIVEDTENLSEDLVQQVTASIISTDLRQDLMRLHTPLLAVYGDKDTIVAQEHTAGLIEDHSGFQQVFTLPKSRHFPFLDQPNIFNRLLMDYLSIDESNLDQLEIKQEWRRRVSQIEYI